MTYDNTLLGRCLLAYEERYSKVAGIFMPPNSCTRPAVAAVLEHLAAELLVMKQRNERLSVHEVARILTLEAAGESAGWDQDEEVEA
jgi:hypothetical protein